MIGRFLGVPQTTAPAKPNSKKAQKLSPAVAALAAQPTTTGQAPLASSLRVNPVASAEGGIHEMPTATTYGPAPSPIVAAMTGKAKRAAPVFGGVRSLAVEEERQ